MNAHEEYIFRMRNFLVFIIVFLLGCSTPSSDSQISQTPNSTAYTKRDLNFCRDWVLSTDKENFSGLEDKTRQIGSKWTLVDDEILRQATRDMLGANYEDLTFLDLEARYIATIERCFKMFPELGQAPTT